MVERNNRRPPSFHSSEYSFHVGTLQTISYVSFGPQSVWIRASPAMHNENSEKSQLYFK